MMNGIISQRKVMIRKASEIGRVKKTLKSPLEIVKALRKLFSTMGPNTNPRTSGAIG